MNKDLRTNLDSKDSKDYDAIRREIRNNLFSASTVKPDINPYLNVHTGGIKDKIEKTKTLKDIEKDGLIQDIVLKRRTLNILFWFLGVETVCIFIFAFLQATFWFGFKLEEWSFRLLLSATITQITAMLFLAVRHLFPNKSK